MSEKMPVEQEALVQVAEAVKARLAEGKRKAEIVKELMKQGWPEDSAVIILSTVAQADSQDKPLPVQKGFWPDAVIMNKHEKLTKLSETIVQELAQGKSKAEIVKALMEQGWSEESSIRLVSSAAQTLENYKPPLSERQIKVGESLHSSIFWGITLAVIGFFIWFTSDSSFWKNAFWITINSTTVAIIGWVAMLFGIVTVWKGLSGWWKSRR